MIKSTRPKALDDLLTEQIITATAVGSLLAGAILGVAFQEMTVAIKESKSRCSNFRDALNSLENTISLLSVAPSIKEMDRLNQELEDSNKREEIIRLFLQQLKKGEALVSKCSSIRRWNLYKKRKYEKRLRNMESSLRELSGVLQVGQALDTQRLQRTAFVMPSRWVAAA
ncbi:uncharacterized protein LOC112099877 [Citrus clementina]|uniref:uncharacterized protein LOC112099877 n=1 Tax=Citrus clementina TaxID=85681 RepID=UPI000CED4DBE|nr:uncharacterized protein LOC112099877 [Citrus x clementina]